MSRAGRARDAGCPAQVVCDPLRDRFPCSFRVCHELVCLPPVLVAYSLLLSFYKSLFFRTVLDLQKTEKLAQSPVHPPPSSSLVQTWLEHLLQLMNLMERFLLTGVLLHPACLVSPWSPLLSQAPRDAQTFCLLRTLWAVTVLRLSLLFFIF